MRIVHFEARGVPGIAADEGSGWHGLTQRDSGFPGTLPELVVSATREVRSVLDARPCDAYLSANRTCEMGLRHATGRPYESFVFLLEELRRPEEG